MTEQDKIIIDLRMQIDRLKSENYGLVQTIETLQGKLSKIKKENHNLIIKNWDYKDKIANLEDALADEWGEVHYCERCGLPIPDSGLCDICKDESISWGEAFARAERRRNE